MRDEIEAVWTALARRKIHYSSITRLFGRIGPHLEPARAAFGRGPVRQTGQLRGGSCLFASIFRKLGLDASLVMVPGHMFVGVDLDDDGEETLYLETTMLGDKSSSFDDAADEGDEQYQKYEARLKDDPRIRWRDKRPRKKRGKGDDDDLGIIDIRVARELGILPIREPGADKARFGK